MSSSATNRGRTASPNPEIRAPERWLGRWVALLLGIATCMLFWPAFHHELLIWDDIDNLVVNEQYRGFSAEQLQWMWSTFHLGPYQPLSWMTFALDYTLWGDDANGLPAPQGFHLTNILLHGLNVMLVFALACRLFPLACKLPRPAMDCQREQPSAAMMGCAAVAAALFGWHPLRVESVAWATERRDVLSLAFLLGATLCYVAAARQEEKTDRHGYRRAMIGCWFLYLASLLSKSIGMTFPVVLLLLDWYPLRRFPTDQWRVWRSPRFWRLCREKIPFMAISAGAMALALYGQRLHSAMGNLEEHSLMARVAQSGYGLIWYVVKTVWPSNLSPLYPLHVPLNVLAPKFLISMLAACLVTGALCWYRHRVPALWTTWCAYGVMVSPMLGLVQSGPQLTADRYSYLPCLPWAFLVGGWLLSWLEPVAGRTRESRGGGWKPLLLWTSAALILILLARQTWGRLPIWHDDLQLWQSALEVEDRNFTAHSNLSIALLDAGQPDAALKHINRAIEIKPAQEDSYVNRALILSRSDRTQEAIADLRHVIQLRPNWTKPRMDLVLLLVSEGNEAAALAELHEIEQRDPNLAAKLRAAMQVRRELRQQIPAGPQR